MLLDEIIGTGPPQQAVEAAAADTTLGRDDFLRMLVAQLEHQDPLNPQDATEFTAQLAQFSSLEQLLTIRQSLDDVVAAQSEVQHAVQSLASTGLIGREAVAGSPFFEVGDEGALRSQPAFELQSAASSARLRILSEQGGLLRVVELGGFGPGLQLVPRDVLEQSDLAPGVYGFEVEADAGERAVAATPFTVGTVSAVVPGGASPALRIGALSVPFAEVREVRLREEGS